VTRTASELSVTCPAAQVPPAVAASTGWRAVVLRGPFALTEVGILATIAVPLAAAGVSIMPVATYDTDYVLVRGEQLAQAVQALAQAGHVVHG
jgi:hypothetical protein